MSKDTSSASPRRDADKEKFWRETLRQFTTSGQSVRAFCADRKVSEPSFYAWRRTLAERGAAEVTPSARPAPAFLPIRLADAGSRMEIVLASGHRIRLRPPVDRAALADVVAALQSLA